MLSQTLPRESVAELSVFPIYNESRALVAVFAARSAIFVPPVLMISFTPLTVPSVTASPIVASSAIRLLAGIKFEVQKKIQVFKF